MTACLSNCPALLRLLGYNHLVLLLTKQIPQYLSFCDFSLYKIWNFETWFVRKYVLYFYFIFLYFIHLIEMKHMCKRT